MMYLKLLAVVFFGLLLSCSGTPAEQDDGAPDRDWVPDTFEPDTWIPPEDVDLAPLPDTTDADVIPEYDKELCGEKVYNASVFAGFDEQLEELEGYTYLVWSLSVGGISRHDLQPVHELRCIGSWLELSFADNITTLKGLENLRSVGKGIWLEGNDTLTDLTPLQQVKKLDDALKITQNVALTSLEGLHNIEVVKGPMELSQNELSDLEGLRGLKEIKNILIEQEPITSLNGLRNLKTVHCGISISMTKIKNLQGIENFSYGEKTSVCPDQTYQIIMNDELESLEAFNLTTMDGWIAISGKKIQSFEPLSKLTYVKGSLAVGLSEVVEVLTGFENLTYIGGLGLGKMPNLKDISVLKNVGEIHGGILLQLNTSLPSLEGLNNVKVVYGAFELIGNYVLTDISALENITEVQGDLSLQYNYALTSYYGLKNLKKVGGKIYIEGNKELQDLNALYGLEEIGGDIEVYSNYKLPECRVQEFCALMRSKGWLGNCISQSNDTVTPCE